MWSSAKGSGIRNHRIPRPTSTASPGGGAVDQGKCNGGSTVERDALMGGCFSENSRNSWLRELCDAACSATDSLLSSSLQAQRSFTQTGGSGIVATFAIDCLWYLGSIPLDFHDVA